MRKLAPALALLALCASAAWAEPLFELSFDADKNVMTMGDELALSVEVLHGKDFKLIVPAAKAMNFPPFELKRIETIPAREEKGGIREGYRVVLTSFQMGDFKIPAFAVPFTDPAAKTAQVFTDEVAVSVRSVGRTEQDRDDIRPIKSPLRITLPIDPKIAALWILGVVVFAALATLGIAALVRRRKLDPESLLLPPDRALLHLSRLEKKKYLEAGDAKAYFTELSAILERYVIEGLKVGAYELTTQEFMEILSKSSVEASAYNRIGKVFALADLAKFAKWVPPREQSEQTLVEAREIIRETRPRETAGKGGRK